MFKWGGRSGSARPEEQAADAPMERVSRSTVLPRFVAALRQRPSPRILDLGPAVGENVTYFGEQLQCKIYVEDLFAEVDAQAARPDGERTYRSLVERVRAIREPVDGVLCWDLFDYLNPETGRELAGWLARGMAAGGVLHGWFGTTPIELTTYTRFALAGEDQVRHRPYPARPVRRQVLLTRDISLMFDGLIVEESVLLKSGTRETLFRKP